MDYLNKVLDHINLADISNVELAKKLRQASEERGALYRLNLGQAMSLALVIKRAHQLGEIRGRALH